MTTASTQSTLSWLISPVSQSEFVHGYLGQQPLRIARAMPTFYKDLLSAESLEYALFAAAKVPGAVEELAGEDRPRRCRNYKAAVEAYKHGKSLRIDSIQRFSREVAVLGRSLEQSFSCPVNINMYLTPPARQALSRHYDTHDVFVLQVHGKKRWRIFDSPVFCPLEYIPPLRCERHERVRSFRLERRKDKSSRETCKVAQDFILEAGDLLYLPRGFWHEAGGVADCVSCHLTAGVQSFTYLDLLNVALAQWASAQPELRVALPFGFGTHNNEAHGIVQEHIAGILHKLQENIHPEEALAEVAEAFSRSRQPFGADLLQSAGAGSNDRESDVVFQRSNGDACSVMVDGQRIMLTFGAKKIFLPLAFEGAARFIAMNRRFSIYDIPGETLTDAERFSLVQRLVAERLLEESRPEAIMPKPDRDSSLRGYLPIRLILDGADVSLRWLHFGSEPLSEPFFTQSVKRIRESKPPRMRATGMAMLSTLPEPVPPSGFIFHISRCGSTLVSNALRAANGAVVISEAQPLGEALSLPEAESAKRDDLLRGLVRAYGQARSGEETGLVIKFSSWNLLRIDAIRRLWPNVPVLIVIRDPLEVMVSCLEGSPGWMRLKRKPSIASGRFGWTDRQIAAMTDEEYCARGLGSFLRIAKDNIGPHCRVIDYANLNPDTILQVGRFFGLSGPSRNRIEDTLGTYSKDPNRTFVDDRTRKRSLITDEMRHECSLWAQGSYKILKDQQFVIPATADANAANA